jgi:O-antigen ligase
MKLVLYKNSFLTGALTVFFALIAFFYFQNHLLPITFFPEKYRLIYQIALVVIMVLPSVFLYPFSSWLEQKDTVHKLHKVFLSMFMLSTLYSWSIQNFTIGIFSLLTVAYFFYNKKVQLDSKLYILFGVYFLIHLISLIWANDMEKGFEILSRYVPFFVFSFLFCLFQYDKKTFDRLLLIYFRGTLIFVFISLLCWIYESFRLGIPLTEWVVIFGKKTFSGIPPYDIVYSWTDIGNRHPSYNAIGFSLSVAIGFYFVNEKQEKFSRIEFLVYLIASALLTIVTQSRVGLVSFLLVLFAGAFFLLRNHKKWQIVLSGVVFLLSIVALWVFMKYLSSDHPLENDSIRLEQYNIAISSIKEKPLLGTGIGNMPFVFRVNNYHFNYPHNQFLGELMQTGILGFGSLLLIIGSIFFAGIKRKNFLLLSLFFCIMFPLMFIEMPFHVTQGIIPIFLFCGLFLKKH